MEPVGVCWQREEGRRGEGRRGWVGWRLTAAGSTQDLHLPNMLPVPGFRITKDFLWLVFFHHKLPVVQQNWTGFWLDLSHSYYFSGEDIQRASCL